MKDNAIHTALQEVWRDHPELREFDAVRTALEKERGLFEDGEALAAIGTDALILAGIEQAQPNGSAWTPDERKRMDELLREGKESIKERTRELVLA